MIIGDFPKSRFTSMTCQCFRPVLYKISRGILQKFPSHEIIVAIAVRGGEHWPDMGLTIRAHEIIDGLKLDYFPPEFRSFNFEGARTGTEDD